MNAATNPNHYLQYEIEPIEYIMRNEMEFWRGNIIKYATRCGSKQYDGLTVEESEVLDLQKVQRYAEMRINMIMGADKL
jgi:hypothetical protein